MPVAIHHIVIDAHDLPGLARFWSEVLGWPILSTKPREVIVGPSPDAPLGLCFMPADGVAKTVKNRLHFDLNADPNIPGDREAEIERIVALGASRVDIGQTGDESWTVLADPEGNEFCVVRLKRDLIG